MNGVSCDQDNHAADENAADDLVRTDVENVVSMAEIGDEGNHSMERLDRRESSPLTIENKASESTCLSTTESDNSACAKEVRHLRKRVANVQESIQLSAHSISNPKTYQDNVLNAVSNCVNEWRSIVRRYPSIPEGSNSSGLEEDKNSHGEEGTNPTERILQEAPFPAERDKSSDLLTTELKKPAALAVFQLIQLAIQCGPLAGGKPGYFKRCGGAVAKVVVLFLDDVVPHQELGNLMGFTVKQMDTMEQWQKSAKKAAADDKPPSRTALKQQQGKGTGKKAKKQMKKK